MNTASKGHVFPARQERKLERIYRIREDIQSCQEEINTATLTGDTASVKQNIRRLELLNNSL